MQRCARNPEGGYCETGDDCSSQYCADHVCQDPATFGAGGCYGSLGGVENVCGSDDTLCCSHNCQFFLDRLGNPYNVCEPSTAGGTCVVNDDCDSDNCSASAHTCLPASVNGTCKLDEDCTTGLVCSSTAGCCVPRGQTCANDSDCCMGSCTGNVCVSQCVYYFSTNQGESPPACGTDDDCCSGTCAQGACTASDTGQPCQSSNDCLPTLSCSATNVCTP